MSFFLFHFSPQFRRHPSIFKLPLLTIFLLLSFGTCTDGGGGCGGGGGSCGGDSGSGGGSCDDGSGSSASGGGSCEGGPDYDVNLYDFCGKLTDNIMVCYLRGHYYYLVDDDGCSDGTLICMDCAPGDPYQVVPLSIASEETTGLRVTGEPFPAGAETKLASPAADPDGGRRASFGPSISQDGRYVAFESDAENLVAGDTNDTTDIFRMDRLTGEMRLVSKGKGDKPADGPSSSASISGDGRYVAFASMARNLPVTLGNAPSLNIYVADLESDEVTLVSRTLDLHPAKDGAEDPVISLDGRFVVFASAAPDLVKNDPNGTTRDVFIFDSVRNSVALVSKSADLDGANGESARPQISADGRFVVFESTASDLVPFDPNGGTSDIFLVDLRRGHTELISMSDDGTGADGENHAPALSPDGQVIAYQSAARNLISHGSGTVDQSTYLFETQTRRTLRISPASVSGAPIGASTNPSLSFEGRFVVFEAIATDNASASRIYVYDLGRDTARLIGQSAQPGGHSFMPRISADGHYIAFESFAGDLVSDDWNGTVMDVFVAPNALFH